MNKSADIVVIGGGAAGFFAAIHAATYNPKAIVVMLEKTQKLLAKVKISGGGRCNVTHHCFDNKKLLLNYPRGASFLETAFEYFSVKDTIDWFQNQGVRLKTESDGRMFPVSDDSESIVAALLDGAKRLGITIITGAEVSAIEQSGKGFSLTTNTNTINCKKVIVCAGGGAKPSFFTFLKSFDIQTVDPVPSLFTFNLPNQDTDKIMGLSMAHVVVSLPEFKMQQTGPLLFTHWGLSGPAVIKLSAFAAKELAKKHYHTKVLVNFLPHQTSGQVKDRLIAFALQNPKKQVLSQSPFAEVPQRLWHFLVHPLIQSEHRSWAETGKKVWQQITDVLNAKSFLMQGKTTFKEEFVTCGGISLEQVYAHSMESKKIKGLYFAGEVLDIDGVTGGFNFQAAWTCGYLAGKSAAAI
jgi:predicted Rossmann fold flavoprotein